MEDVKRTLMIIVRLSSENLRQRTLEAVPRVKTVIERLSQRECKLAFTTSDGASFAYFLNTAAPLAVIRAELYGSSVNSTGGAPLLNVDSYLAVGISGDIDGVGFSQAWNWLQHHRQEHLDRPIG